MKRSLFVLAVVFYCVTIEPGGSLGGQQNHPSDQPEGKPPTFNFKLRQFLIEGSYRILPSPPKPVAHQRQLLMDNFIVDDMWGCRRTVHPPLKHSKNPLLASVSQSNDSRVDGGTVWWDTVSQRLRLWGRSWYKTRPKFDQSIVQVYYESQDGIQWAAPDRGLVEFEGKKTNHIIQGERGIIYGAPSVVRVPERLAAKGKFAMLYGVAAEKPPPGQTHAMEQRVAWSDDGFQWKDQPENPVIRGRSDTFNNMVYNPERDVFMMYRRPSIHANEIRRIAYSESKDLIGWTQPQVIILPDELDPSMVYGMSVTRYQGVYLGMLQMFYMPADRADPIKFAKSHRIDIQLAWSRDGLNWQRHPERPIFLPTGAPGTYDWGMVFVLQGLPERDNQVYVYYNADEAFHIGQEVQKNRTGQLCLATLRKDGFVSLDAPEEGYMLTRPLLSPGGKLHINARTQPGGYIRVAVRRADGVHDGNWIDGWNYESGPVFRGDAVDSVLEWKEQRSFDGFKNQAIRLHFWMQKAELYSFWFE